MMKSEMFVNQYGTPDDVLEMHIRDSEVMSSLWQGVNIDDDDADEDKQLKLRMKYESYTTNELEELYTDLGAMGRNMDCTPAEFAALSDILFERYAAEA